MATQHKAPKCQNHDKFSKPSSAGTDTMLSYDPFNFGQQQLLPRRPSMRIYVNFYRLLAIPACVLMGLTELIRLQRSRLLMRR